MLLFQTNFRFGKNIFMFKKVLKEYLKANPNIFWALGFSLVLLTTSIFQGALPTTILLSLTLLLLIGGTIVEVWKEAKRRELNKTKNEKKD